MQIRLLWSCVLSVSMTIPACSPKAPAGEGPDRTRSSLKRAIIPVSLLSDRVAICRSNSDAPLPGWADAPPAEFFSVTRSKDEVSIIIADSRAPREARCERTWRLIMVKGPLDFNQVGIIAGLSGTLAEAGVSIFALSTYDTDYVMVKQADLDRSVTALRQAGYAVSQPE